MLDDVSSGLISAFVFVPGAPGRRLTWAECLAHEPSVPGEFVWIHLNVAMQPARRWLGSGAGLPETAVEPLLDPDPHYHIVSTPAGFLLTLNDWTTAETGQDRDTAIIRVWVDRRRLITVRRWPILSTDRLRRIVVSADFAASSSVGLLVEMMDLIADNFGKRIARLRQDIDKAEDALLADRTSALRTQLGTLRRTAVSFRRVLAPEHQSVGRLSARGHDWMMPDEVSTLKQAFDEVASLVADVREAQERAKVLQDEFAAKIAEETNTNLYVLSTVSVVLLPMTFITGVFGMNVGGLPFLSENGGFSATMAIIGGVGALTALLLRYYLGRGRRR